MKLEARRLVPGAERIVESEGDPELVVLLYQGHLVVVARGAVAEDVRCFKSSALLSERCCYKSHLVLEYSVRIALRTITTMTTTTTTTTMMMMMMTTTTMPMTVVVVVVIVLRRR